MAIPDDPSHIVSVSNVQKNPFLIFGRSRQITIDPDLLFEICYQESSAFHPV